jgi:hypothetical protein
MADKLNVYDNLAVIKTITSPDGRFNFSLQDDGNLILYIVQRGQKDRFTIRSIDAHQVQFLRKRQTCILDKRPDLLGGNLIGILLWPKPIQR